MEWGFANIESLEEGIKVLTYNEQTGEKEYKPILKTTRRTTPKMCVLELSNGETLRVTPEHRFFNNGKWTPIEEFEIGDLLQTKDDVYLIIENKTIITTLAEVFNLEVEGNENYFVTIDGVLVHNGYKGTKTDITSNMSAENQRSLQRENESADLLSKDYDVYQNPQGSFGGKNPYYLIDGEVYDCYSPKSSNPRNIASEMEGKVIEGQTNRIVLNMDDTPVSVEDMQKQLNDWPITDLEDVIGIKDGDIIHIYP